MSTGEENTNHSKHQLRVLTKFRNRLEKAKFIHNQASNYYMKSNRWFVIPGIIITGSSSVISFLGTSDIISDNTKTAFNITVGVLTAGSAILQSISSSFGFELRTAGFSKAADDYDTLITKVEFELCSPNEYFQEFCDNLEEDILKIKNDCKFIPPLFCHQLYEKEMKRRNTFKDEHIDNSYLTSILIQTPKSSPIDRDNNNSDNNNSDNNNSDNNNSFNLSVPNISTNRRNYRNRNYNSKGSKGGKILNKLNHSQFQDAEEDANKLLSQFDENLNVKQDIKSKNGNVKNDII